MFSEDFLLKNVYNTLIHTNPRIERIFRPIYFMFVLANGFLTIFRLFNENTVRSVKDVVNCCMAMSFCLVTVSYGLTQWKSKGFRQIYEKILAVGVTRNTTQETDWILFLLVIVITWLAVSMIGSCFILSSGLGKMVKIVILAPYIVLVLTAALKHLIAKRLRYIRSSDEYLDRIEDSISHTRQLLECNSELNKSMQGIGASFSIFIFVLFQCFIYTAFVIYGAGIQIPGALENSIVLTLFSYGGAFTIACLAVWSSSLVPQEVEQVKLELDATKTARACTKYQQKLIRLFLMELHHTPVKLSAMGLFDIDKSTFSSGCCITISYLLVLIQFT